MKGNRKGLTLVELLVGMALMGIILTALVSFFMQSSKASMQSSARADLQQETLNAQQLIAGKLKEAWYIYPQGQTIKMTDTALTQRPAGGNTWTVGTDPILAMLLPPRSSTNTCNTTATSTAATGPSQNGCYRFLAYFPVKRSVWVAGTGTDSWRNPGPDAQNDDTWVLAEYRGLISSSPTSFPPSTLPAAPTGNTSNLLTDYVAPTTLTTGFTTSSNTYTMFGYGTANGSASSLTNPVNSVTLNLGVTRQIAGKLLRLPNATDEYTISVFPTNLGKIAAN